MKSPLHTKVTNHILFPHLLLPLKKKFTLNTNFLHERQNINISFIKLAQEFSKLGIQKNRKRTNKYFGLQNNSLGSYSATQHWKMEFYDEVWGKKKIHMAQSLTVHLWFFYQIMSPLTAANTHVTQNPLHEPCLKNYKGNLFHIKVQYH